MEDSSWIERRLRLVNKQGHVTIRHEVNLHCGCRLAATAIVNGREIALGVMDVEKYQESLVEKRIKEEIHKHQFTCHKMRVPVADFSVNLTYFKRSGKFITSGTYTTNKRDLHEIWEEVREMRGRGHLPKLTRMARPAFISVDVPGHQYNHPRLLTFSEYKEEA